MKIVSSVSWFTWLILLQNYSCLNCPPMANFNPDQCICHSRISSDKTGGWEMTCFTEDRYQHAFIVDYAVNKHLLLECASVTSPYTTGMYSNFNATEINTFEFRYCALPNASFSDILGGENVYSLIFESRNNITGLTDKHLENMNGLKVLILKRNGLSILPRDLFKNQKELQDLRLNDNSLQLIDEDTFNNLFNLSNLEMGNNLIRELPVNVFSHLYSLRSLYLYKNKLTNMPAEIFNSLRSLVTLDLSSNLLQEIPETLFEGLSSVERISLRGNRLQNLPSGVFISNTALIELELSNNPQLQSFPEYLFNGLSKLKSINIEGCNVISVPQNLFSSLANLQTLKMSNNRITKLHPKLFYTNINLNVLLLDSNLLQTLPDSLFEHQYSLTVLGLFRNDLRDIPSGVFKNLVKLKALNMAYNNITHIDWDVFNSMQYLETLVLSNNKLQQISNFGLSRNLKKVDLSNNVLTSMPQIKELIHLQIQEINLEHNNIDFLEVPTLLSDCASVRLGWNNISLIDIDNLIMIYNANQLSEPDPTAQKRILKCSPRFYIFPNPIQCDCQISHFASYIASKDDQYSDQVPLAVFPSSKSLICNQPTNLRGKKLMSVSASDFLCSTMEDCPSPCSCYKITQGNKLVVNCSYRSLENLPSTAPWNTSVLIFSGNKLQNLDSLNEPLWENLTELYLDDNPLSDFGAWKFMQNLTYISLERNAFSHLSKEFMSYTSVVSELKISLARNPWVCSCSTIDMKGWLIENFQKVNDVSNIYCLEKKANIGHFSVLRASKEMMCPTDPWQHKLNLVLVCCFVVIVPLLFLITIILYYRNWRNIKTIFSEKSHYFRGEKWLWRKLRCATDHRRKRVPEVPSQAELYSKETNPDLLKFVEDTISSLHCVPNSREQDKPLGECNSVVTSPTNILQSDIATIECTISPKRCS